MHLMGPCWKQNKKSYADELFPISWRETESKQIRVTML